MGENLDEKLDWKTKIVKENLKQRLTDFKQI